VVFKNENKIIKALALSAIMWFPTASHALDIPFCARVMNKAPIPFELKYWLVRGLEHTTSQMDTYREKQIDEVIKTADPKLLDLFIASSRSDFKEAALLAIQQHPFSDQFYKYIKKGLKDGAVNVRVMAVQALEKAEGTQAANLLAQALFDKSDEVIDEAINLFQQRNDSQSLAVLHDLLLWHERNILPPSLTGTEWYKLIQAGASDNSLSWHLENSKKIMAWKMRVLESLRYRSDSGPLLLDAFNNNWTDGSGVMQMDFWMEIGESLVLSPDPQVKQAVKDILFFKLVKTRIGIIHLDHSIYTEALATAYFKHPEQIDMEFVMNLMDFYGKEMTSETHALAGSTADGQPIYNFPHSFLVRFTVPPIITWLRENYLSSSFTQIILSRFRQATDAALGKSLAPVDAKYIQDIEEMLRGRIPGTRY